MLPNTPRRSNDELREAAELFLHEHHPGGELPVPIEEIIELRLGLDIVPIRGLRDRFGIEGFLSTDLSTIYADEGVMTRYLHRYRFTLAHELGHLILHADIIRSLSQETPEEWKRAVASISPQDYGRIEREAYEFAGCVLVPRAALLVAFQEAAQLAETHGIDLEAMQDTAIEYVAGWIARQFQVSTQVISRRLKREGVLDAP